MEFSVFLLFVKPWLPGKTCGIQKEFRELQSSHCPFAQGKPTDRVEILLFVADLFAKLQTS